MPAEELDAVGADLHSLLGDEPAGERGLAGEVEPLVDEAGGAEIARRMPSSSVAMSAMLKATAWRWEIGSPKAIALVHVGDQVVDDRLRGADRERSQAIRPRRMHSA